MKNFLLAFIILLLATASAHAAEQTYCLIVHKSNVLTSLSITQVKRIFLGKNTKWVNGNKIDLVLNHSQTISTHFSRQVLNKTFRQLDIYWRKALYSGRSKLPLMLSNDLDVIEYVSNHPDAISFISNEHNIAKMKVIKITP